MTLVGTQNHAHDLEIAAEKEGPVTAFSNQRKKLEIRIFPGKGRGVVAAEPIAEGELIERAPVVVMPAEERAWMDKGLLFTYVFMWEKGLSEQELYKGNGKAGIALGYISLLNHSYTANCTFVRRFDQQLLDVVALRPIKPGEELTIDYQMDLWFDPV